MICQSYVDIAYIMLIFFAFNGKIIQIPFYDQLQEGHTMNNDQLRERFNNFFSPYWEDVAGFCPFIGAFMLDHTTQSSFLDENCERMLCLPGGNRYLGIKDRINAIECGLIADLELKIIVNNKDLSAGIIKPKNVLGSHAGMTLDGDQLSRFRKLIENNMFLYHFQPIIDSHTGEIVAYEALMRTPPEIGMTPLEVLEIAEKTNELYSIEKATMFNTLRYMHENISMFDGKKLFVNAISAHILKEEDWAELKALYGDISSGIVIELTEHTEVSDADLAHIQNRIKQEYMKLAIDDYGTGYSNTSNLLRYKPDFVKLDRALISEIDTKPSMQKLVAGLIDFMHTNSIMVLAEGVETLDEISTVIKLGVDLIQGYYVSKPKPFIMESVADSTKNEINSINLEYQATADKVYHTVENDNIDIHQLAVERYTTIVVESENVSVQGRYGENIAIRFIIKDDLRTNMKWHNVNITCGLDDPAISLGKNSSLTLITDGLNNLSGKGILVPSSADFTLTGGGEFNILSEKTHCFAIGSDKSHSHGNITLDMYGTLNIEANGDDVVAIGAGRNSHGKVIAIKSGRININASGNNCVGIGTLDRNAAVDISHAEVIINISGSNCLGIGTMKGNADIKILHFATDITLMGLNLCAIGCVSEGAGTIDISEGQVHSLMKGREMSCIGAISGLMDIKIMNVRTRVRCEGNSAFGIGDSGLRSNVSLINCDLGISISSQEGDGIGACNASDAMINCQNSILVNAE